MKYEFEKKPLDKGIFSWKFNVRYWLLKKLGLNGYTGFIVYCCCNIYYHNYL